MKRQQIAVVGLGNRLLCDEGFGLHAIERLWEIFEERPLPVDLVDAGTPGMGLLHQFQERKKIVFIDCGFCGLEAGEYKRFVPGDAVSLKKVAGQSLHDFDLMGFLEFADSRNLIKGVDVVIYCMQAADMSMSEELSPATAEALPSVTDAVYREVQADLEAHPEWGDWHA